MAWHWALTDVTPNSAVLPLMVWMLRCSSGSDC